MTYVRLDDNFGYGILQQYPLVGLGDVEYAADFLAAQAFYVAQRDNLALPYGQVHHGDSDGRCHSLSGQAAVTRSVHGSGGASQASAESNRAASTVATRSLTVVVRRSRTPAVLALLIRMRNSHVRTDDRPSNRLSPCRNPSHASCTTSSATAWLGTYPAASRSMDGR
jgi:hypothetical protein